MEYEPNRFNVLHPTDVITESSSDVVFIRPLESVTLDVFIEEEYL